MPRTARVYVEEPRSEPHTSDTEPLFRTEVLGEQKAQWLGNVLLQPRLSFSLLAGAAILAALAVLAFLFLASFTRKAHISGWLVPEQGLARIFAPQTGVVTRLYVREGARVAKGRPLMAVSSEVQSEKLGATREQVLHGLEVRHDSLARTRTNQSQIFEEQAADLRRRLEAINAQRRLFSKEIDFQRTRLDLMDDARDRSIRGRDLSTIKRVTSVDQDYLERAAKLQSLERSRISIDLELQQVQSALREVPLRRNNELAQTERSIAELEQEIAESEARRQIVITAPQDGTVTGLQVELGGSANPGTPLMNLVPDGSALQAQLFGPSRAIGFVRPGQRVMLRYQAFPYQKFGLYEGVIESVSGSAVSPAELTQQLAGLAGLYGTNEPIYRVTVNLKQQTVLAYGEAMPLQPGMRVEADVLVESRRLIEWLLDPLYSLTGKLK
jgi:membrane fusion protein